MNDNQNPQQQQFQIELGEKEAEGIYSNLAIISHSRDEVVVDFTRMTPGTMKARVLSRIIMTPRHAKLLLLALQDNVRKFEQQFGEIDAAGNVPSGFSGGEGTQFH